MSKEDLIKKLEWLMTLPAETEWLEFKGAKNNFDFRSIGKYFSALSNEANLKNEPNAWLIFGIQDTPRKIGGTKFRENRADLDNLKAEIADKTTNRITFIEIHELVLPEGRVLMFEIPPAPPSIPIAWEGHYHGRDGQNLSPLNLQELETIRSQDKINDWSNEKCLGTTIDDLDNSAINFMRTKLVEVTRDRKYSTIKLPALLNSLFLLNNHIPTNTAILFLGKTHIAEKYLPEISQITWRYEDKKNSIVERKQFKSPLLLALYAIENEIRRFNTNLTDNDLFRVDIKQYDDKAIEELLVNSIAHREWKLKLWVEIVQSPSGITFRNPGFFRANLESALKTNLRPPYINQKMAEFFQKLNLMEKEGGGLQTVYIRQLSRGTRILPTFHTNPENPRVDFALNGKVENVAFARLVLSKKDIELEDLILLDKIASGQNKIDSDISKSDAERLLNQNYIEIRGTRYKQCFISEKLSKLIGRTGKYIVQKGFTKEQKIQYILNYIDKYGQIKMSDTNGMFENVSYESMKILLSVEMCKNLKLIKRIKPSSRRIDWYYIKV